MRNEILKTVQNYVCGIKFLQFHASKPLYRRKPESVKLDDRLFAAVTQYDDECDDIELMNYIERVSYLCCMSKIGNAGDSTSESDVD